MLIVMHIKSRRVLRIDYLLIVIIDSKISDLNTYTKYILNKRV